MVTLAITEDLAFCIVSMAIILLICQPQVGKFSKTGLATICQEGLCSNVLFLGNVLEPLTVLEPVSA